MSHRNFNAPHNEDTAFQLADYFPVHQKRIIYLLWKKLQDGHTCIHWDEVTKPDTGIPPEFIPITKEKYLALAKEDPLIVSKGDLLYLNRYYHYESTLIEKIKELVLSDNQDNLFRSANNETDMQQAAIQACLQKKFVIISGGPGTGKTTTVAKILAELFTQNANFSVALAAPTGKAAARMAESLQAAGQNMTPEIKSQFEKLIPTTIHRLLGTMRESIYFRHNQQNPLPFNLVIVDESSMIDLALFSKLLWAVGSDTKLILLGDRHQLASVEAGSVFGDLCSLSDEFKTLISHHTNHKIKSEVTTRTHQVENIIELKKSYRFSEEKGIGRLSKMILGQDIQQLEKFMQTGDAQITFDTGYDKEVFKQFVLGYSTFILEKDIGKAIEKLNHLKVLCATREGNYGVYQINAAIEKILEENRLIHKTGIFYHNRPVMITKNNYSLQLFNGDTGIVREDIEGKLKVWFEQKGELKCFPPSFINGEETAFAITIHKSQGSEYNKILTLLPSIDNPVLTKELLYTAVTRAKEEVVIQSNKEILFQTISRNVQRGSGIKQRFLRQ